MRLWLKFARKSKLKNLKTRTEGNYGTTKRFVASCLGRELGAFTGKCFYQIIRRQFPYERCFSTSCRRPLERYSECGPGARAALNILEGLPATWQLHATGQAAADVFNGYLLKWKKIWRAVGMQLRRELPDELHEHIDAFLAPWFDETWFQFVLCEMSKIIAFILVGAVVYSRGYWRHVEQQGEPDEEEWSDLD